MVTDGIMQMIQYLIQQADDSYIKGLELAWKALGDYVEDQWDDMSDWDKNRWCDSVIRGD